LSVLLSFMVNSWKIINNKCLRDVLAKLILDESGNVNTLSFDSPEKLWQFWMNIGVPSSA